MAAPNGSKLLPLLSSLLPALGLPAIPIDPDMVEELKAAFGSGKISEDDSEVNQSWALVSQIGVLRSTGDHEFREIVETILSDQRYEKLSRQLLAAMIAVGREKAISHAQR